VEQSYDIVITVRRAEYSKSDKMTMRRAVGTASAPVRSMAQRSVLEKLANVLQPAARTCRSCLASPIIHRYVLTESTGVCMNP